VDLYSAFIVGSLSRGAHVRITRFYLRSTLYMPPSNSGVHQMAPPMTDMADI